MAAFTFDVADASTEVNKPYARKSSGRVSVTANTETSRRRVRRPEPTESPDLTRLRTGQKL
ncbi:hypothetical protein T03_9321 [Trichinella britovi]|nr:hypothetical protein T03_9321 [Trichinella britovi]